MDVGITLDIDAFVDNGDNDTLGDDAMGLFTCTIGGELFACKC